MITDTGRIKYKKNGMDWRIDPARVPVKGPRSGFLSRFMSDRVALIAIAYIVLITVVSSFAPVFTPYGRDEIDLENIAAPSSATHVLGTDYLGRDLFTRLIYGARYSLFVAVVAVAVATVIGVLLGTAAGYFAGWVDRVVTALVDLHLSIPLFLVLLVACSVLEGGVRIIPLVIGMVSWMETARVSRARIQSIREAVFVQASFTMGENSFQVVLKHILPYAAAPIAVSAAIGFANAMLIESALSFLGYGVPPPIPTWGNMLDNARTVMRSSPMAAFAPGFLIFITCLCFNLVGRSLKNSLSYTHHKT